jgi:hypothetical protein
MPMVGKKEYAYTAKGIAMAKKDAKNTGKNMVMKNGSKKMSMMKKMGKTK